VLENEHGPTIDL